MNYNFVCKSNHVSVVFGMELSQLMFDPKIQLPSRPRRPWLRAAALALTALTATAQEEPPSRMRLPGTPTLVFLASQLPDAGSHLEAIRRFKTTALRDLKESGVFRLLDPGSAPREEDQGALSFWRGAGANFLVRYASRSLAQGRLVIESECINLETGAVVLKKSFMGEAAATTRMAHRMVDFVVGKVTGTQGAADSTIVVARSTGPGIKEIFGLDRDGRNPRQLTQFGSLTTHPALAPDGRLACVTYRGGPPQIWGQIRPDGPFQRWYPPHGGSGLELSDLIWSPDGSRLCFVQENRKGLADIHVLDPVTGQESQLTPGGRSSRWPSWNPAGTQIAFLLDQGGTPQVYLMAADGGRVQRLTGDPAPKACVAWDAQGDRIAFVAREDGQYVLYTLSPAGTDRQKVASGPEPVESLCWSPDGRWLLLGLKTGTGPRLRLAGLDGKCQDLGDGPGDAQFPQWTLNPVAGSSLAEAKVPPSLPGPAPLGSTLVP